MANGFVEFDGPVSGRQLPVPDLDLTQSFAGRTRLRFRQQLRLLERQILRDVSRDSLSNLPRRGFNAGKGGRFAGDLRIV